MSKEKTAPPSPYFCWTVPLKIFRKKGAERKPKDAFHINISGSCGVVAGSGGGGGSVLLSAVVVLVKVPVVALVLARPALRLWARPPNCLRGRLLQRKKSEIDL